MSFFVAGCALVGSLGAVMLGAPMLVGKAFLSFLGFAVKGVGLGSVAAYIQSFIGKLVAGSLFAAAQSAGMGGAGMAIINGIVQTTGAIVLGAVGIAAWLKSWLWAEA